MKDIGVEPLLQKVEEAPTQMKIDQVEEEAKEPVQNQGIKALLAIESGNEVARTRDEGTKEEPRALSLVSVIEQNQN